jgi:hypothetical protein
VNIPGNEINKGEVSRPEILLILKMCQKLINVFLLKVLAEYIGSGAPKGTGTHKKNIKL